MDRLLRPERFAVEPNLPSASQEWSHWFQTFENFISATTLPEDAAQASAAKLNLLINHVAPAVYDLIAECSTYGTAVAHLQAAYVKPVSEIYARHLLTTRKQQSDENVDQYLQALKALSRKCNFKSVTASQCRDENIRDSFIGGLASGAIRQRLLENSSLTLQEAYDQARALESAQIQSSAYENQPSLFSTNAVTASRSTHTINTPSDLEAASRSAYTIDTPFDSSQALVGAARRPASQRCFFCGYDRHLRSSCPAKNATCRSCRKRGHYASVCKASGKNPRQSSSVTFGTNITASSGSSESSTSFSAAAHSRLIKSTVLIKVNRFDADALIDTGSSESFISYDFVCSRNITVYPFTGQVSMASTMLTSNVQGHCVVNITIHQHKYKGIKLLILKQLCSDVIIGHDILKRHSQLEVKFGGERPPIRICCVTAANVPEAWLFKNMSPNCRPIATKSRKHSDSDEAFIKSEITKLLKEGIIEESRSPWRAQVLVTSNSNHKKRMVIDYSQTANRFTLLDAFPLPRIDDIVQRVSKYKIFSTIDLQSAYHQIPIRDTDKPFTAFEACGCLYQFKRIPFGVTNGVAAFQRVITEIIKAENLRDTFAYLDDVTICGTSRDSHDANLKKFLGAAMKYNLTINESKSKYNLTTIKLLGHTIENGSIKPDPDRLKPLLELPEPTNVPSLRRTMGLFAHYSRWIPNFSYKISPLAHCHSFPISKEASESLKVLKQDVANAVVKSVDNSKMFVVETDASDFAIAATLSQDGKPVAFFSRTLHKSERGHSSIEKEAYAIVEALRKWKHFLLGRHFKLITDQKSVSFMFDEKCKSKIKNDKILRWRLELSAFKFDIIYRPGRDNCVADTISRVCSFADRNNNNINLYKLHDQLCHPGITRMFHWIKSKNLPISLSEVRQMISSCRVCSEIKPQFFKFQGKLIKSTSAFERLNIDFKGPLPTRSGRPYLLTVIDEFSRFPFAFPCSSLAATEVIKHLKELFFTFGIPSYIHSDRGPAFIARELKSFCDSLGIATSRTSPYNPKGNGQVERYNGIIWRTVKLALKAKDLELNQWETVLPSSLHSIRSLLCTATNATPHERMFNHQRRSPSGISIPTWLTSPGPVLMRRMNRGNKYEPLVEEVQLLEANPEYARVQLPGSREMTVSLRHLAPLPRSEVSHDPNDAATRTGTENQQPGFHDEPLETRPENEIEHNLTDSRDTAAGTGDQQPEIQEEQLNVNPSVPVSTRRRPERKARRPAYLEDFVTTFKGGRMS